MAGVEWAARPSCGTREMACDTKKPYYKLLVLPERRNKISFTHVTGGHKVVVRSSFVAAYLQTETQFQHGMS